MTQSQVENFSMLHFHQLSSGWFSFLVLNLDLPLNIRNFLAMLSFLAERISIE